MSAGDQPDSHIRRVVVVDDHAVVRTGVVALLNGQPDIKVVGEAASGEDGLALVARLQPDVVVMDVRMRGMDGVQACREITRRHPGVHVILLTAFPDEGALVEAMLSGARGYVLKDLENDALVRAIRTVAAGGTAVDPALARSVVAGLQRLTGSEHPPDAGSAPDPSGPAAEPRLSGQECAILRLVARGRTNREIAAQLFLSEKTVRNYLSSVLDKLGLRNRAEAAAYAAQHGLVDD